MAWYNYDLHEKFEPLLRSLKDGSKVAVLTMRGSCCPVTRAHCEMQLGSAPLLVGQVRINMDVNRRESHPQQRRRVLCSFGLGSKERGTSSEATA